MLQNEEEDQEEPNNPLFLINQVSNEHPNSNAYNSKRTDRKSQSAPVPLKQNKQNKTKKPSKVSDMKWFSSTSFTRSVSLFISIELFLHFASLILYISDSFIVISFNRLYRN